MIAIGIVSHDGRRGRGVKLSEVLDAEVVAIDEGGLGAGANHEVAWSWLAESDELWSLVVEDDAIPVMGFREHARRALESAPSDVCSLYLGRSRPAHWQPSIAQVIAQDHHYLLATEVLHHVALAMRTSLIPGMLAYIRADSDYRQGNLPIDEAIGRWSRSEGGRAVCYSHPSLCDHDHKLPTLIRRHVSQHPGEDGRRDPQEIRRAWAFGTRKVWDHRKVGLLPEPTLPPLPSQTRKGGRAKR